MTSQDRLLTIGAIILGTILLAAAVMYATVPPKSLPGPGFLGHENGVSTVHVKHAVGCSSSASPASSSPGSAAALRPAPPSTGPAAQCEARASVPDPCARGGQSTVAA